MSRSVRESRRWRRAFGPLLFAAGVLALGSLARGGQSLAEVAKAEAERRKTVVGPSRVYTNKDLKPARPSSAPSAAVGGDASDALSVPLQEERDGGRASGDGAAQRAADASADDEADRALDEQRWRRRLSQTRDQVERSRTLADALQSQVNALTADFSGRDDPAQRAVIGAQLTRALAELERVRAEIDGQQNALVDLEEEARRAGVPPGWLR